MDVCIVQSVLHYSGDGWRLLKGKVYENESQIQQTCTHNHAYPPCTLARALAHTHTSILHPRSLVLCQEAICLGKPKGDLVFSLHWKSNEDSNDGHSLETIFVL